MHRTTVNNALSKATNETFRTPMYVWSGMLEQFPEYFQGRCLDPAAGDGRLIRALVATGNRRKHKMLDIRASERKTWNRCRVLSNVRSAIGDFTRLKPRPLYDTCVTNPPFSLGCEFVTQGLKWVKESGHVIILHRLNWLGTGKRSHWLKSMPLKRVIVIAKRPIWEIDGRENNRSDTYEYSFYVFQSGYEGAPTVDWLF